MLHLRDFACAQLYICYIVSKCLCTELGRVTVLTTIHQGSSVPKVGTKSFLESIGMHLNQKT